MKPTSNPAPRWDGCDGCDGYEFMKCDTASKLLCHFVFGPYAPLASAWHVALSSFIYGTLYTTADTRWQLSDCALSHLARSGDVDACPERTHKKTTCVPCYVTTQPYSAGRVIVQLEISKTSKPTTMPSFTTPTPGGRYSRAKSLDSSMLLFDLLYHVAIAVQCGDVTLRC